MRCGLELLSAAWTRVGDIAESVPLLPMAVRALPEC